MKFEEIYEYLRVSRSTRNRKCPVKAILHKYTKSEGGVGKYQCLENTLYRKKTSFYVVLVKWSYKIHLVWIKEIGCVVVIKQENSLDKNNFVFLKHLGEWVYFFNVINYIFGHYNKCWYFKSVIFHVSIFIYLKVKIDYSNS